MNTGRRHQTSRRNSSALAALALLAFAASPLHATNYWSWDCESTDHPWFNRFYASSGLVTTAPRSGERCVQIDVIGNDGGNQGRGTDVRSIVLGNVQQGQWFYFRWWMKLDAGFSWGTGTGYTKASRLKCTVEQMTRLWTGYLGRQGVFLHGSDTLPAYWEPNGVSVPYAFRAAAGTGWHEYIIAMKMQTGPAGSDGEFHFHVDGARIGGKTGIHYLDFTGSCSEAWNGWMVSPYFQLNGTPADGGTLWLDDYSFDDCWNSARYPDPSAPPATYALWRAASFGADTANDSISGPLADPDGAGVTNLQRYAFALPARGPVANPVTLGTTAVGTDTYLTLTFPRRATADGLTYTLESSSDLATWTAVPARTYTAGTPATVTAEDSLPTTSGSRRFLRVRVSDSP